VVQFSDQEGKYPKTTRSLVCALINDPVIKNKIINNMSNQNTNLSTILNDKNNINYEFQIKPKKVNETMIIKDEYNLNNAIQKLQTYNKTTGFKFMSIIERTN